MFGSIDKTLKPKTPKVHLAKPDGVPIGHLTKFLYGFKQNINLGSLNDITFTMPYDIEDKINHRMIRNPYIDNILERYLLKIQLGKQVEWYIITEISDDMDDTKDVKTIRANSLGFELNDEIIQNYKVTSYSLWQVANETVADTLWTIGEIDSVFEGKFRSFDVPETSALDFISQIAETFGALLEFDTVNRKIHFRNPETVAKKQPLTIGYGKYMKSLGKTSKDEMVTRLYVKGKDGLSINRVNPAGASYLEDFSYFLFPFERDENRNVIKHSKYMSDSLCHAILDYNELLASKEGVFASLLEQQEEVQKQLTQKNNEMFSLKTQLAIIETATDVQRAHGTFFYRDKSYTNKSDTIGFALTTTSYNAVMLKVYNSTLNVNIDGSVVNPPKLNQWFVAKKITDRDITYVNVNGTGRIEVLIVEINLEEYNGTDNNLIINNYNQFVKEDEIKAKQLEIDAIESQLKEIEQNIKDFQFEISIENNFTPEQLKERKQYIIKRTWTDENYFDDEELLKGAKEKFLEYKTPKTTINLDIINFLQVVEEQSNWDKLNIGDEIGIRYEKINIDVRAKITQISYDYDANSINLTIANVKDLFGEAARLLEMLKTSYATSTSLQSSKTNWNEAFEKAVYANDKLNSAYDAAQQRILAGARESVDISNRGITIRNPDFPNELIRMTAGVIGLSKDGGLNWQTAITGSFIVAEAIMGKLLIGENLEITDDEGTFLIKGNLLTVKDRNNITRLLLGEYSNDKFGLKLFNKSGHDVILDEDGMLQSWQEGRADNVDFNNGLALYVYIPEQTLSVRMAKLRFKLLPFRSYSRTTDSLPAYSRTSSAGGGTTVTSSSGGGSTQTSSSGGGVSKSTASGGSSTQTSSAGGVHRHLMFNFVSNQSAPTLPVNGYLASSNLSGEGSFRFVEVYSEAGDLYTYGASDSHSHNVNIPSHTHNFETPNHTHTVTIPNHTHNVSVPNHTHDVEIPAHSHEIEHGIYTYTSAYGVGIIINGINRTTALGGKFYTDVSNIDITQYMAVGAWNEILLTSERLGRIDANVFIQAFLGI